MRATLPIQTSDSWLGSALLLAAWKLCITESQTEANLLKAARQAEKPILITLIRVSNVVNFANTQINCFFLEAKEQPEISTRKILSSPLDGTTFDNKCHTGAG